jgi:hypothetical protein
MKTFEQPQDVDGPEMAFGGKMSALLPPYKEIPEEFKRNHPYCTIVSTWFFQGLPKDTEFVPMDGVDGQKALRHIKAIMSSWEPKHEHKTAGAAYLLSRWFKEINVPPKSA